MLVLRTGTFEGQGNFGQAQVGFQFRGFVLRFLQGRQEHPGYDQERGMGADPLDMLANGLDCLKALGKWELGSIDHLAHGLEIKSVVAIFDSGPGVEWVKDSTVGQALIFVGNPIGRKRSRIALIPRGEPTVTKARTLSARRSVRKM